MKIMKLLSRYGMIEAGALALVLGLAFAITPAQASGGVKIDKKHFANEELLQFAKKLDRNHNGFLSSKEEKAILKKNGRKGVITLHKVDETFKGIQYFKSMKKFVFRAEREYDPYYEKTATLDLSHNKNLTSVELSTTCISALDVHGLKKLKSVKADHGPYDLPGNVTYPSNLKIIKLKGCTALRKLNTENDKIKEINVSYCKNLRNLRINGMVQKVKLGKIKKLKTLYLSGLKLKKLNLSHQTNLRKIGLFGVGLKSLDISKNKKLVYIGIEAGSTFTRLNVRNNTKLEKINLLYAGVRSLDLSKNKKLKVLYASFDNPDLSKNPELEVLSMAGKGVTKLDVSHNPKLKKLQVCNTGLEQLDLSQNHHLEYLDIRNTEIKDVDISNNLKLKTFYKD